MSLIPWAPSQWTDDLGRPLAFGKLYLYQAGTLIPKATYQDAAHTVAHTFPIVLDATGRSNVWLIDDEAYDLVVHDSDDNVMRSVLGIVTDGGPLDPNGPGFGALFEKCSFPEDEILWLPDPTNEWWRDDGCFCWIFPAQNFATINYIKSIFGNNNGHITGRYSIWGFLGESETKLVDNPLPDSDVVGVESLNQLDISPYTYIGVAMDPGHDIGGGMPIRQNSLVYPTNPGPTNAPAVFGFIGQHAQNTAFASWPTIKGADPKYLITKWMALGLSY